MKTSTARIVTALALALSLSGTAWADHGHHGHFRGSVGIFIGDPFWPWYYRPYYYPPVVAVPAAPPVYIEQGGSEAPANQSYWYYCDRSQGYYPYVKDCPGGWKRVVPTPPPS